MELFLLIIAPYILVTFWGLLLRHRTPFWIIVILTAPTFSAVVICAGMVIVGVLSGTAPANPANPNPLIVQWLAASFLVGPGILLFGAVPAMLGSLTTFIIRTSGERR